MENPIKANLNIGKIVGFLFLGLFSFAILDFFGATNWLLFPVTTIKAKLAAAKAAAGK